MHLINCTLFFSYTYRSERVGKTNVGGTLLTEAKYINLSLHYLEQVRTVTFVCHSWCLSIYWQCAVATVDVLMANSYDVNLAKTRYVHPARPWNRRLVLIELINSTTITCIGKFYHLFAPWNTTWHSFYLINPWREQRWRISWIRSIQLMQLKRAVLAF